MAKKRRRKRRWLRNILVFIIFPLAVWFIAFFLWIFWYDIPGALRGNGSRPNNAPKVLRRNDKLKPSPPKRPEEKLFNEDRKRLEDIINKRR